MKFRLVLDFELERPGCALIQAAYGGDHSSLLRWFPAEMWLIAPTDGMRIVEGTADEFAEVARRWSA